MRGATAETNDSRGPSDGRTLLACTPTPLSSLAERLDVGTRLLLPASCSSSFPSRSAATAARS